MTIYFPLPSLLGQTHPPLLLVPLGQKRAVDQHLQGDKFMPGTMPGAGGRHTVSALMDLLQHESFEAGTLLVTDHGPVRLRGLGAFPSSGWLQTWSL